MDAKQIQRMRANPAAFRAALVIDADGGPRRLADCMDDWQRADFEALDPGWKRAVGVTKSDARLRAYLERPRGHSKTSDLAVMVSWALFSSHRKLTGVAAAADKDQAALLRDAIERLVKANPWLGAVLEVHNYRVRNRTTGSELEMISSDAATSYGIVPDFILVDELTHWGKRELWDSLVSSAARRSNCLLAVISNAGWCDTWQWATREAIRLDDDWYFSRLDGPRASWITEKNLAQQRRLLPAIVYDRLWGNKWSTGSGDALREGDITAALKLKGPLFAAERGWVYFGGLDIGVKRDNSAFAVVGLNVGYYESPKEEDKPKRDDTTAIMAELGLINLAGSDEQPANLWRAGDGKLRLAALRIWKPTGNATVPLEQVENAVLGACARYRLASVAIDPSQAYYLTQRVRQKGVKVDTIDPTPTNMRGMATETLEAFSEGRLELFKGEQLLKDLRALKVKEMSYGVRLVSPRGPDGHGDSVTALSLALLAARRRGAVASRLNRPLVCFTLTDE